MKNLANKLVKKLIKKNLKISFAESCTGGMLSSTITSVSGSSKVFNLGSFGWIKRICREDRNGITDIQRHKLRISNA